MASRELEVRIGKAGSWVGSLVYAKEGRREHTAFAYDQGWLTNPDAFEVSPDLKFTLDHQYRRAPTSADSPFPFAIADTAPDAWGRRIILREHARRRAAGVELAALTELDFLLAVDDFSRVGALRLVGPDGQYEASVDEGRRRTLPLLELPRVLNASNALERGAETAADLRYLQGKGSSLGGMRPKCTVLDHDGRLAIAKFPSVTDTRSVTRGEVLASRLARSAGIDTADARIELVDGTPVVVVRRFDRDAGDGRIPYLSAASMLQASRQEDRAYTEVVHAIEARGDDPARDRLELWRRLVFNLLITNVDDHLQNLAFLHVGHGQWRLAPAFDLNPFPDKDRESKTWLSEEDGPITDIGILLSRHRLFSISESQALGALREVRNAVANWRVVARSPEVGLSERELDDFAPAFEHRQMEDAARV